MSGVIVEVSARTFAIPFECPCCGSAPDAEVTVAPPRSSAGRISGDVARGLEFPYCRSCVAHATAWSSASTTAAGVLFAGLAIAVIVAIAAHLALGLAVVVCAVPIAMAVAASRRARAKAACGPACASPGPAITYLGGSGTSRAFAFESPTYTARFGEQNAEQLSNVSPQLRGLIEGHRIARLVVPTPAAPITVVSPPPMVHDWIARLEAANGRVARRNVLHRALEVVHEPTDRQRLLTAACQLELAPVLDRLDERSSAASRRRQIETAIGDVRADNLSDELRGALLRELHARMQALA